jgi:hypothetical protein
VHDRLPAVGANYAAQLGALLDDHVDGDVNQNVDRMTSRPDASSADHG